MSNKSKTSRKSTAVFLITVLLGIYPALTQKTFARYNGGTGDPNDPYRIATPEDLNDIGNHTEDWNKHFVLINDVNLAQYTGTQFKIIGNFTGIFDGNDHKICNFTWTSTGINNIGVFNYSSGQIKNMGMENVYVNAVNGNYIGVLAGKNAGLMANCYSTGTVTGMYYVGGLVGLNYNAITDCYSTVSVSGSYDVGGLVGVNNNGTITNSYSKGTISGSDYTGGLVGESYGCTITNCYFSASVSGAWLVGGLVGYLDCRYYKSTITNSYSSGTVSGNEEVGGLVGESYGGTITGCYSVANVSGTYIVGGLVGQNGGATPIPEDPFLPGLIYNCYSTGTVSTTDEIAGGLVGCNFYGTIANCYSTGIVSGNSYIGGLVGCGEEAFNSFWDIETSGQLTSAGGTGKTTSEMKTATTYLGWNGCGEVIWTLDEGNDYPHLAWEGKPGQPLPNLYEFVEGSGTQNDPYLISTAQQLNLIGLFVWEWSKHFKLVNDVNLSSYSGTKFNIIGIYAIPFTGVFDGNNHKVWNFTWYSAGKDGIGLFGYVGSGGQIKNLGIENVNVKDIKGSNVGGLVGYNSGIIIKCYSSGTVSGGYYVGGLVGSNSGTISSSYSSASISGGYDVGGLVGRNGGTIINCYASTNISSTSDHIGGLVGYNGGMITNCYSSDSVSGHEYVGGLVGYNWYGMITNCFSTGNVSGTSYVGGLVGYGRGAAVVNSFWDTETSGQSKSAGGKGKTTSEMKTATTYLGWNGCGEVVWTLDEGNDYPHLAWEGKPGQPLPQNPLSDFLDGNGTEDDPYLISTAQQLNLIGLFVCEWSKHFKLVNDVNLSSYTGTEFNIIGGNYLVPFTGVFDGNDHKICNFTWNSIDIDYVGLFVLIGSAGHVKNLGMENVKIYAANGSYVGALVGLNWYGTITNCYSTGSVSGNWYIGGLIGYNDGKINSCYSAGVVSGTQWYVGGLVGINSYGIITNCYSSSSVSGNEYVGGLSGKNEKTITNCYSIGSVKGNYYAGGLIGYNDATIINCYSAGRISEGTYGVGGLIGYGRGAFNSFWDIETSGQSKSAGGTGKTTAEMKTKSTFTSVGWDFVGETINGPNDIWRMCVDGVIYPLLSWQFVTGDFACPDGVDFIDFASISSAWLSQEGEPDWNPACDISEPKDNIIDELDLAIFCENWLAEKK